MTETVRQLVTRLRIAHEANAGYHLTAADVEKLLAAAELGADEYEHRNGENAPDTKR